MRKILPFLLLLAFIISCDKESKKRIDVSHINIDFTLKRFDIDFYNTTEKTLEISKKKYPLLFPKMTSDSVWLSKINDKDEKELFKETQKVFPNLSKEKAALTSLFKHIKYYNPTFKEPTVITLLTNLDYQNRIVLVDSLLLISLDSYLGKTHVFYGDYPGYIKENNHKNHLIVDVANAFIKKQVAPNFDRTFLGKIVFEGKKMYLLDRYLPAISDKEKIGYTKEKLDWTLVNEEQIWKYFLENKMLFSTETKLNKRFIENAPFSKFYLSHDNESPGRIGIWLGWQIVRSYMQHNDVSLQELLQINATDLLKKSTYKPRK